MQNQNATSKITPPCFLCGKPKDEHYAREAGVDDGPMFRCNPDYRTSSVYVMDPAIRKPLPVCHRCNVSPAVKYFQALHVCCDCFATLHFGGGVIATNDPTEDPVNHPSHYTFGKIEVADALEDWQLNLWRGTAVKYIVRAGRKRKETELEDLKKAAWYLAREIARMKKLNAYT